MTSLVDSYKSNHVLDKQNFFECMIWIGLLRLIYYFPAVSNCLKSFFLNISIFSQCLLVVISLIAFMAFIGLSLFKNRLKYCLVIDGNFYPEKSRPIALANLYDLKSDKNYCINAPFINDVFYFHQLQIKVNSFSHFFNFDTTLNAIECVFQLMKGSDFSIIQLITSILNFDEKLKNSNQFYWHYIILVLFLGILIDAFVFSVIAEMVNQSLVSFYF